MATLSTIQARIDEIDTLLASGVKSASYGETRIDYDPESLRAERGRLLRQSASMKSNYKRVVFKSG